MRPIALVVVLLLAAACTYIPPSLEPVSDPPTREDPSPTRSAQAVTPSPITVTQSPILVPVPPRAELPGDPLLIGCDSPPFPVAVLDEPTGDEFEDHPSAAALRQLLTLPRDPGVGDLGWRRIARDETAATYLTGVGPIYNYFTVEAGPTGWEYRGYGECTFYPDLDGHNPVIWALDPAFPAPEATSRVLHLLVLEQACASGKPVVDRLLAPAIAYEPDGVFITFAALPPPGDGQDCQGNEAEAVTVRLREPLGDRTLRGWEPPSGTGG